MKRTLGCAVADSIIVRPRAATRRWAALLQQLVEVDPLLTHLRTRAALAAADAPTPP